MAKKSKISEERLGKIIPTPKSSLKPINTESGSLIPKPPTNLAPKEKNKK